LQLPARWGPLLEGRMTDRIARIVLVGPAILAAFFLVFLAYSRPWYFGNVTYLGGLLFLEFTFVAICMYRRVFFPLVLLAFLFAGSNGGFASIWTSARWVILGLGALVGCVIILRARRYRFGVFHLFAMFAVLAALLSATASRYPSFVLLKALSLLLLFVYCGTGARLAVAGREHRFFAGLLTGCEVLVGILAVLQFSGAEPLGNPNSLGAVMGVVGAPILLWGMMLEDNKAVRLRRLALFAVSMYIVVQSQARAAMIAAFVSCGIMCLVLRKQKLLAQGSGVVLILIATAAIVQPEAFSNTVSSLTSAVLYKGHDPGLGMLSSRESPWQTAMDSIRDHFWFGTGFGTADKGQGDTEQLGTFASSSAVKAENGSSYLSIAAWVGVAGVLPFLLLLLMVVSNVIRTLVWMFKTGNSSHPAIPLAMVMVAGLLHAAFEDWLFAPGYYLCVFFWSAAFVLADTAPIFSGRGFNLDTQNSSEWSSVALNK
jgi:O-antigen ligase